MIVIILFWKKNFFEWLRFWDEEKRGMRMGTVRLPETEEIIKDAAKEEELDKAVHAGIE